jgi:hypothetical protein
VPNSDPIITTTPGPIAIHKLNPNPPPLTVTGPVNTVKKVPNSDPIITTTPGPIAIHKLNPNPLLN